jgi:DNA-binding CsgD family transcriptional regulator
VAGPARGSPELRRLLQRAIDLRPQLRDEAESTQELLERLRASAEAAGAFGDELAAVEALLELVDEHEDPLSASALRVRRCRLLTVTGAGAPRPEDARQAVALAAADPTSWQHALALGELTRAAVWAGDPGAGEPARRAVSIARAAGRPGPLSYALTASAMVAVLEGHYSAASMLTREAGQLALTARDWLGYTTAAVWEANAGTPPQSEATADRLRRRRNELSAAGAPHVFLGMLGAAEAQVRLVLGDWPGCANLLRDTLGSDLGVFVDINSRVVAAMLDAWQGRPTQATMHLDRAAELLPGPDTHAGLPLSTARAVVALAAGHPAEALRAALDGARAPGAPPHMCEWLIPLAARALADLAEADADAGRAGSGSTGRSATGDVDALVEEFPRIVSDPGPGLEQAEQSRAMQAWYDAEVARARRSEDLARRWWAVAEMSAAASLPWVEVYAWWRAAEAHLARGRDGRRRGIDAWRRAGALADRLDAAAITGELETLARVARVPTHPDAETSKEAVASLPGVTPREREILAKLVAGSTYAEIAAALVISEKTVSSHVSNLLRKTGTANRVELARLVTRLGLEETTAGGRPGL